MTITEYNVVVSKWHMLKTINEVRRMPGKDGTGPMGFGSMTGRGLGLG